jgi:cephalosporin hydroxylase
LFEKLKLLDSGSGSTLEDYKFLYGFISLVKPHRILDIGTNHGLSAIVMAMALRDCGLKKSRILTIDINKGLLEIANIQICNLGLSRYIDIKCCDSSALDSNQFFDVVFIDGDHTFEGCMRDFDNVKNRANYVLIHDTAQFEELSRAVKTIDDTGLYDVININDGKLGKQWSLNRVVYQSYPGISIIKVR